MRKNTIGNKFLCMMLAFVMMTSFAAFFAIRSFAAEPDVPRDVYIVADRTKTKAESLIKILTELSKAPAFKETLAVYFGPCAMLLQTMLPEKEDPSLDDISRKLDEINSEIQGKIVKEADRVIAAMDGIPDIIDVRSAKRNITALKKSIENAQNNIGVDLSGSGKTAEEKLRKVARELGGDPSDWGLGSTINGVEVLAEDITVKDSDIATAVATNSLDNLYVSMYRYQCTKSALSGEAIDRSADFVRTTYGIYLNCATTILQYLDAKAQVAVIDGDEDLLKKVEIKIDSFLDDMTDAAEAVSEFFTLNRIVFVGGKADAAQHVRLAKELGFVDHKANRIEDIDAVFRASALSYDEVKSIIERAKASGEANPAEYLKKAGFSIRQSGADYVITGKGYKEGGTVSVPFRCLYKGVELGSGSFAESGVRYHQFRVDCDTLDVYDKQWYDGAAVYFPKAAPATYEFVAFTADDDFENFKAYLLCKETGLVFPVDSVTAVRTDEGENANIRTYAATAYFEGRAYTGTQDFAVKMYAAKQIDGRTVLTLNWGSFNGCTINWASVGGREAVNEIRVRKGVKFFGDCSGMFSGLVNCEIIETENAGTDNVFSLKEMFAGCAALRALDLSGFDTALVRDFSGMFSGCVSLQSLDLSGFDTRFGAQRADGMFADCVSLARLVLPATMNITADMGLHAKGDGFRGWARESDPDSIITGKDRIAVLSGAGTYVRV